MGDGPRGYGTGGAWRLYPASLICWFSGGKLLGYGFDILF